MLFIHIVQGEVIPRDMRTWHFLCLSNTESIKSKKAFLKHRLVTELGKRPLIGPASLLQSAEERSLREWRVAPSILSGRGDASCSTRSSAPSAPSTANTGQWPKGCWNVGKEGCRILGLQPSILSVKCTVRGGGRGEGFIFFFEYFIKTGTGRHQSPSSTYLYFAEVIYV